ncbi:phosphotransferase [Arthrobacter sp. JZ12]|uniref:hypothetical protein n=1 Tax=Arthrobacter sp. JZ12 TaxID=2654190 RepID=UPI002B47A1E9|nr:hypothetical protein [Arthrobacter sp. JZ12]WRH25144.1 phosphotransferase [Arthrobacter sp. JZ12]
MRPVPDQVVDEYGITVQIRRAWPREDGRFSFEGHENGSGRLRAGMVDASGTARLAAYGVDPSLPGLESAVAGGELLVHRYKRRAVVRVGGQYRKFLAGEKAAGVASAHLTVLTALSDSGLTAPDVVTADQHSVTLTAVPGTSLHELGQRTVSARSDGRAPVLRDYLREWESAWDLWAGRWPGFVRSGAGAGGQAGRYGAEDEIRTVAKWAGLAAVHTALNVPAERLGNALSTIVGKLASGVSPAQTAHRDLHDKQLLMDAAAGTVGIIDCDTLAIAEPALDLANISVHLDFRVAQGLLSRDAASTAKIRIHDVADHLKVPPSRFEAYAAATALRLACLYAFRPPYQHTAALWFDELERRLGARHKQSFDYDAVPIG